jgi:hypothetical protein
MLQKHQIPVKILLDDAKRTAINLTIPAVTQQSFNWLEIGCSPTQKARFLPYFQLTGAYLSRVIPHSEKLKKAYCLFERLWY